MAIIGPLCEGQFQTGGRIRRRGMRRSPRVREDGSGAIPLARRDCNGPISPDCKFLRDDAVTPHRPEGWETNGAPLSRIHYDV